MAAVADIAVIGLAVMGQNLVLNMDDHGFTVAVFNRTTSKVDEFIGREAKGTKVVGAHSLEELVGLLKRPRRLMLMVQAGKPVDAVIDQLLPLLEPGDIIIDGGNSRFTDDFTNAKLLGQKGIGYVDCGVSGGVWGLENGYGLMAGGDKKWITLAMPIFDALRPAGERDLGFVHAGEVGAGHYAKMVHNGIEYAMMQAYGEGYELLEKKDIVKDVPGCFKAWSRGTVVRSWLLDLLVDALEDNPTLADVSDYTNDSGEGRWTVEEAIDNAVPMPVISASLFARFASRQDDSPAMRAVAALRNQFGGHAVKSGDADAVPPAPTRGSTPGQPQVQPGS